MLLLQTWAFLGPKTLLKSQGPMEPRIKNHYNQAQKCAMIISYGLGVLR